MEIAVLGLGCFWGPEIKFSKLEGIIRTEVGYCGGINKNTTYEEVCTGKTNHAEVVKLEFDPDIITYKSILEFFFIGDDRLIYYVNLNCNNKFNKYIN